MTLKTILKTKNARKLFGKKELNIIQKQLQGINLTQSEKNRLSRDIRPKLQCVLEIAQFKEECKLEKNQENKKIIKKTITTILKEKNIKAILLFGSHANNTQTIRSDIDIAVVFKKPITLKEATKFRIRISGQLPKKVDIQVFQHLPQRIKKSLAKNHQILYKTKEFDNITFTTKYIRDNAYFLRMGRIFEVTA